MIAKSDNAVKNLCLLFIFSMIFVFAWQSDDAYHAHRMTWNFMNGNGLVYNPGERVSATTAPLFTLTVTAAETLISFFAGEVGTYWPSLLVCFACSFTAIYIMQKWFCKNNTERITAVCLLALSSAFISYTTSGLENSMLFLLSGIFVILFLNHGTYGAGRLLLMSFVSSLLITTRMDNALIVFPALVYAFLIKSENKIGAVLCGILGMLPFILWEIFSTVYYGFPFPNTAYIKLSTGFPLSYYIVRGTAYFFASLVYDPISILIPAVYIFCAFRRRNIKHSVISTGIVLYCMYLLYIGGDFMLGRHYTVSFFIAAFCIFDILEPKFEISFRSLKIWLLKPIVIALAASVCLQILVSPLPILHAFSPHALDERRYYFAWTSIPGRYFFSYMWNVSTDEVPFRIMFPASEELKELKKSDKRGDIFVNSGCSGVIAYAAENYYVGDAIGLGDPLLARLPAVHDNPRIGHMVRVIPEGYRESIQTGENRIADPSLRKYYDVLCLITRGKALFAPERLQAVADMNLGRYDYLIDEYAGRNYTGRYVENQE